MTRAHRAILAVVGLVAFGTLGLLACRVQHRGSAPLPSRLRDAELSATAPSPAAPSPDAAPPRSPAPVGEPFDLIADTDGPLVGGATVRLRFGGYARVKLATFAAGVEIPADIGGSQSVPDRPAALEAGQVVDRVTVVRIPPDDIERCIVAWAHGDGTSKVAYLRVNPNGRPRTTLRLTEGTNIDADLLASEPLHPDGTVDVTLHVTKLPPQFTAKLSFTLPEGAELLSQPADPTECTPATPTCSATIRVRLPPRPGFTVKGNVYVSYRGTGVLELSDSPGCGQ
jgi:hypothetical protein